MAFQVLCNFPRIESYKDALKAWDKGVIFPRGSALRGLVDKRKKHLTVVQTSTGDIVLGLYLEVHGWVDRNKIVEMLRDRSKWRELAARYQDVDVERALREIREAIHDEYHCIDHTSVPFLS